MSEMHVGLVGDTDFYWVPLSTIVRKSGFRCTVFEDDDDAIANFRSLDPPLDVLMINLATIGYKGLEVLEIINGLREGDRPQLVCIDNLFERKDPSLLAQHGVGMVIDKGAPPQVIADELKNKLLGKPVDHEGRKVPRVPTCFPVEYKVRGRTGSGYCASLSVGGLYVLTRSPALLGEDVDLRFVLPGETSGREAQGRVLYISKGSDKSMGQGANSPPGMGMKFVELDQEFEGAIDRYVQKYIKRKPTSFQVIFGMDLPKA